MIPEVIPENVVIPADSLKPRYKPPSNSKNRIVDYSYQMPTGLDVELIETHPHIEEPEYGTIAWANQTYLIGKKSYDALAKWLFDYMIEEGITLKRAVEEKIADGFEVPYSTAQRWVSALPEYRALKQEKKDNPTPHALEQRVYDEKKRQKSHNGISGTQNFTKEPDNPHVVESQALPKTIDVEIIETPVPVSDDELTRLRLENATLKARLAEFEKPYPLALRPCHKELKEKEESLLKAEKTLQQWEESLKYPVGTGDPTFILGLSYRNTYNENREKYLRLMRFWHPDNCLLPIAAEMSTRISKAWETYTNSPRIKK